MRRIFIVFICASLWMTILYAQPDSLLKAHQRQISKMEQSLRSLKSENEMLKQRVKIQGEKIGGQNATLDSLKSVVSLNRQNIRQTANQLGVRIDEANTSLLSQADTDDLKSRTVWGIFLFVLLVIVSFFVYCLLHRRIAKGRLDVAVLKQKADKLNEDILNQFSLDMVEMQKLTASLVALSSAQVSQVNNADLDHSLIKTLADRITFMEMTLYKMDKNVRGYKQLSKSIAQMKDNLKANGYELVEMLGKPYNDGMKVIANFIEDEELKEGMQIITSIIKPQINYEGIMIQSAQITVSQNS